MNRDHPIVVVGCGGLGSAPCHWLAQEAGPAVLGLEQFPLGHHRGASQDHSRIIRLAQHQDVYAGHAFKLASLIGQVLTDLALRGKSGYPLDGFRLDRPAVTDPSFTPSLHV